MTQQIGQQSHAICDYEGTSYRARFWEGQGRDYEDLAERNALRRLLPPRGRRLLEVGAGFGRLVDLYGGYDQIILLDYAKSGLREAQERLGRSSRFLYVAADLYHLPLAPATCDTVVTVRVLHHVADVPAALCGIAATLRPGGSYVLEYANKRNVKAIARYLLGRQPWSPFAVEPYEFAALNFDFHPAWMARELRRAGFRIEAGRAVSHFRHPLFKRLVPAPTLAALDSVIQGVGADWKLSPSIFVRAQVVGSGDLRIAPLFCCPACAGGALDEIPEALTCRNCGAVWAISDGIYDFKTPLHPGARPNA
ncbi:MAG: methyltransferase domain-containing protein [Chloroflexi bacterium]|nr:methyltransferase domain-containing protein [Chloroflexota bacterium]